MRSAWALALGLTVAIPAAARAAADDDAHLGVSLLVGRLGWHVDGPNYDEGTVLAVEIEGAVPLGPWLRVRGGVPAGVYAMDSADGTVLGNPHVALGATWAAPADGQPYRALHVGVDLEGQLGMASASSERAPRIAVHDLVEPLDPMRYRAGASGVGLVVRGRWAYQRGHLELRLGGHWFHIDGDTEDRAYRGVSAALGAGVGVGGGVTVLVEGVGWNLGDDHDGPGVERAALLLGATRAFGAVDADLRLYLPLGDTTIDSVRERDAVGLIVTLRWRP